MASPKDKPRGYFEFLLAMDGETTGLNFKGDNAYEGHQLVSLGLVVADAVTLKPIEDLYVEIKWNEQSKARRAAEPTFGKDAEKVHGLTYEYLEEHGISEEEAVTKIVNLIIKYWGPTVSIRTLGHNVHLFDMPFVRDLCRRHGIELSFGNRHYDTNSAGFITLQTFNSDDLFEAVGCNAREEHNALDDTYMALKAARVMRSIFKRALEIEE